MGCFHLQGIVAGSGEVNKGLLIQISWVALHAFPDGVLLNNILSRISLTCQVPAVSRIESTDKYSTCVPSVDPVSTKVQ